MDERRGRERSKAHAAARLGDGRRLSSGLEARGALGSATSQLCRRRSPAGAKSGVVVAGLHLVRRHARFGRLRCGLQRPQASSVAGPGSHGVQNGAKGRGAQRHALRKRRLELLTQAPREGAEAHCHAHRQSLGRRGRCKIADPCGHVLGHVESQRTAGTGEIRIGTEQRHGAIDVRSARHQPLAARALELKPPLGGAVGPEVVGNAAAVRSAAAKEHQRAVAAAHGVKDGVAGTFVGGGIARALAGWLAGPGLTGRERASEGRGGSGNSWLSRLRPVSRMLLSAQRLRLRRRRRHSSNRL